MNKVTIVSSFLLSIALTCFTAHAGDNGNGVPQLNMQEILDANLAFIAHNNNNQAQANNLHLHLLAARVKDWDNKIDTIDNQIAATSFSQKEKKVSLAKKYYYLEKKRKDALNEFNAFYASLHN